MRPPRNEYPAMRARIDQFASLVTLEMGKLIEQSRGEVVLSADIIDYYAKNAEHFLASEQLKPRSGEAVVENTPFGVLFGIQPWNFPYYQLARFAAPNLMAGNVVMVKHESGSEPKGVNDGTGIRRRMEKNLWRGFHASLR